MYLGRSYPLGIKDFRCTHSMMDSDELEKLYIDSLDILERFPDYENDFPEQYERKTGYMNGLFDTAAEAVNMAARTDGFEVESDRGLNTDSIYGEVYANLVEMEHQEIDDNVFRLNELMNLHRAYSLVQDTVPVEKEDIGYDPVGRHPKPILPKGGKENHEEAVKILIEGLAREEWQISDEESDLTSGKIQA